MISRAVVAALGFHFEVGFAGNAVQDLDPALLRHHLLQSLWYMHGQPPLWNAVLGLGLHVFPSHWPQAWHVVFLALGLVLTLSLYALLRLLAVGSVASVAVAAAFSVTPAVLLYENEFFYDYPTLVFVTGTTLAVGMFVRRQTLGRGFVVFGLAAALVLSRTLFQIWWLLILLAVLLVACSGHRRAILLAAALPAALVAGVYVKNIAMYGVPSTTSWTRMGVARVAVLGLPARRAAPTRRRGKAAPGLAREAARATRPVRRRRDPPRRAHRDPRARRGVRLPVPTQSPEQDVHSDLAALLGGRPLDRQAPARRVHPCGRAWARGLLHLADGGVAAPGRRSRDRRLRPRRQPCRLRPGRDGKVGVIVVAAYAVALGFGLWVAMKRLRPGASAADVTVAFAALTILYVLVVGNLAEVGENFRFRLVVDPLAVALVAAAVQRLVNRRAAAA